ncbi:hypothetical protein [Candidatus Magnetaquicoccus inordinatus]|uniref:hypothetical protein n=1 Tax=Candidatus Magnetaquicoccus inordinatus TaxID=2496818 RepID=UPI00102BCB16|nr:hypothetical protein [Candidatus Magnetaquicoccus inordinatus]
MKKTLHRLAGWLALVLILCFWWSSLLVELFFSTAALVWVKNSIVSALFLLLPLMMLAGASGFALAGQTTHPLLLAKRRRMPFIALNGLLLLLPCALFLAHRANQGLFDEWFYAVQGLELLAGAGNVLLLSLNIRDARRFAG